MKLEVIPVIMMHTLRWCYIRALRRKYKQIDGAPQGMQCVVGLVQLCGNKKEHEYYKRRPGEKNRVMRMRWIDDTIV